MNDLMKDRYIVRMLYPNCPFLIGQILTDIGNNLFSNSEGYTIKNPEKYPEIFNKLEWYIYRFSVEMPKYLKVKKPLVVDKEAQLNGIEFWEVQEYKTFLDRVFLKNGENEITLYLFNTLPATKEEFLK